MGTTLTPTPDEQTWFADADNDKYGCDGTFTGRFPVFDYNDNLQGNPLGQAHYYGGHFEQGMVCTGPFEIRGGPQAVAVRAAADAAHAGMILVPGNLADAAF